MKRETIVAVTLGVSIGIIVALAITFISREKKNQAKQVLTPPLSPTVAITKEEEQALEITKPTKEFVTNKKSIKVEGKAAKDSLIIIQSPIAEEVVKLVEKESFSIDFPLSLGENMLRITAYKDKNVEEKTLPVYYLDQ